MKRKEFLRFSAAAAFGSAMFPSLLNGRTPPEGSRPARAFPPGADEEKYWEFVRAQFPLETPVHISTPGGSAPPRTRSSTP